MVALLLLLACTEDLEETGRGDLPLVSLEEVGAEDAEGVAVLEGQVVQTTGIATVASGVLAGRKLRIHIQDGDFGVAVDADEVVAAEIAAMLGSVAEGDLLLLSGRVTQRGLPSQDAEGERDGLTRLRIAASTDVVLVDRGLELPEPILLSVAELEAGGDAWEGALVRVLDLVKDPVDAGTWVSELDNSTIVDARQTGGGGPLKVRLGKGEYTGGYGEDPGEDPFGVVGPLREDTTVAPASDPEGMRFEIWPRREEDILR